MSKGYGADLLRYLRSVVGGAGGPDQTDRELLARFAARRDEEAFAALVRRHGGLVWGVCRRVLGQAQDAEDAFQAVFLVLARKAARVPWQDEVGNWLYAVAWRVARKARGEAARRRARERQVEPMPEAEAAGEASRDELERVLDEELGRLPRKYREPIVLCYLQGKTYTEAARLLGWPEGTLSGRLARARDLLGARLSRRGFALPAATLSVLLEESATRAAPAALIQTTVQAALAFAAGPTTGPAAALAEGAMHTMIPTGLKKTAALLLALACVTTGALAYRAYTHKRPQEKAPPAADREVEPDPRPALPAAWKGRWEANPFAGVRALEVEHRRKGPGPVTYRITDPRAVAALVGGTPVIGVQNGIAVGLSPTAFLVVRRKDGTTFRAMIGGQDTLYADNATVRLRRGFDAALNRQLSAQEKQPIDVLQFLPAVAGTDTPPRVPPASARSLTAGFKALTVQFAQGKRLWEVRLTDEKAVEAIHKALTLVKQTPVGKEKSPARGFTILSKDGSTFYGQLVSDTVFFSYGVGRFEVRPDFVAALDEQVSKLAGRKVDLLKDNAPTAEQVRRGEQALRRLRSDVTALRLPRSGTDRELSLKVDRPGDVAELLARLTWAEMPAREEKLARGDVLAELVKKDGKTVRVTRLETGANNERVAVAPLMGDLVEVTGFGQVWIDNQWKYALRDYPARLWREAEEKKAEETTRLVARDWPAFVRQVISVTAHYAEGDSELMNGLTAAQSRPILAALRKGKVEKLDWSRERWLKEMQGLNTRGAGGLDLAPGLGFSLSLIVRGEKEMLIPFCGKLTFADSPLPAIRRAIADDSGKDEKVGLKFPGDEVRNPPDGPRKAEKVRLLPR